MGAADIPALAALRCKWQDSQSRAGRILVLVRSRPLPSLGSLVGMRSLVGSGEPSDGRAEDARLDDMVASARLRRAVAHRHAQLHLRDHRALGPEPLNVAAQPVPRVAPRLIDDVGPAHDLAVTRPPARLPGGLPVVVAGPDRNAEHQPGRHPARHDQLGEILPRQVRGEGRRLPGRGDALCLAPAPVAATRCARRAEPVTALRARTVSLNVVDSAPRARTAVPTAVNSCPPSRYDPRDTRSPTTPSPPSSAHSAVSRSTAVSLAWSMARTSGPSGPSSSRSAPRSSRSACCPEGSTCTASAEEAEVLGQLYPSP